DLDVRGTYRFIGDRIHGNVMNVSGLWSFNQGGGVVEMRTVNVTGSGMGYHSALANLALTNGILNCGTLTINENGVMHQYGGQVNLTNGMVLHGRRDIIPHYGDFIT